MTRQDSDPIAEKLQKVAAELKEEKAAGAGEQLLHRDFEAYARQEGPKEFEKIKGLLRDRAVAINSQKPPEIAAFLMNEVNHRLEAGKFAVGLEPFAGLRHYTLIVRVGLDPNAHMSMAEVPQIRTVASEYHAGQMKTGFSG
jgi:hypothetical protein